MEYDGKVQIITEIGGKISETRQQQTVRILLYRVFFQIEKMVASLKNH